MLLYLWVALGSAIGGVSRFWLSGLIAATKFGSTFPLGTLVINVTGSFIIGFFNAATDADGRFFAPASVRTFFMIGVCGGYTTFSSDVTSLFRAVRCVSLGRKKGPDE
jgi:CrcB protein